MLEIEISVYELADILGEVLELPLSAPKVERQAAADYA